LKCSSAIFGSVNVNMDKPGNAFNASRKSSVISCSSSIIEMYLLVGARNFHPSTTPWFLSLNINSMKQRDL